MLIITRTLFTFALLTIPFSTFADLPPLNESYAELAYPGTETLSILTVPNGTGSPFTAAFLPGGIEVDATITLFLRNYNNDPIPNFPKEDIWLEATDNGLVSCFNGTNPDFNTDVNGNTFWINPLRAGGYSIAFVQIMVNGSNIIDGPGLNINTNSPDINGDLTVSLGDLSLFGSDYFGPYHYRSDFNFDGMITLSDLLVFYYAYRTECP